jgi:hypothetical protein
MEPAPDEHLIPDMPAPLPIQKASVNDAGCWISGANWGWQGTGRVVQIAVGLGWPITADDVVTLDQYMSDTFDPDSSVPEAMDDMHRDAESWLTDNVAPEGYSFGWVEGDFCLASDASWCAWSGDPQCFCTVPHDENGEPVS